MKINLLFHHKTLLWYAWGLPSYGDSFNEYPHSFLKNKTNNLDFNLI